MSERTTDTVSQPLTSAPPYMLVDNGNWPSIPTDSYAGYAQGTYSVSYQVAGGKVVARMELVLKGGTLQPEQYPAFRDFLGRLDAALRQRIDAQPLTQTAALN